MTGATTDTPTPRDLELQGACPLCGGDLAIRLGPDGARSVCRGCGTWARPVLHQGEDGLHLHHPAPGLA